MKNALILLLFVAPLCAQTKKHVPTEAEKCWKSVQQISLLDLDKESENFDSLSSLTMRLSVCADTLRADKFKSAVAENLNYLLLTLRDKRFLQKLNATLNSSYQSEIVSHAQADKKLDETTAMLRSAISAYTELSDDYQRHLASDVAMSYRSTPAPALQSQRGYWANVLNSMNDAAQVQAAKPHIHCTSTASFNTVDTDCQ